MAVSNLQFQGQGLCLRRKKIEMFFVIFCIILSFPDNRSLVDMRGCRTTYRLFFPKVQLRSGLYDESAIVEFSFKYIDY